MPENLEVHGLRERSLIENWERRYWSRECWVSPDELWKVVEPERAADDRAKARAAPRHPVSRG